VAEDGTGTKDAALAARDDCCFLDWMAWAATELPESTGATTALPGCVPAAAPCLLLDPATAPEATTSCRPRIGFAQDEVLSAARTPWASGEAEFSAGMMGTPHLGHWYPEGAVCSGRALAYLSRHSLWYRSVDHMGSKKKKKSTHATARFCT